MNFTEANNKSPKRLVGLGVVILLHVLVAYILMSGLGKNIVKVIQQPVELQIIQDIKPPPPPPPPKPETKPIEPPKMVEKAAKAPDPKPVETPRVTQPQSTPTPVRESVPQPTAPSAPSPSPVPAAPVAPPAPPAPPPKPAGVTRGVSQGEAGCQTPAYPREAEMSEITGTVRLLLDIDETGKVVGHKVTKSSGDRTLDKSAIKSYSLCTFKPAMKDGAPQKSQYTIEYEFRLD